MSERLPDHRERLPELDALRGIAALMVLAYHYTTRYDELYGHTELSLHFPAGNFGVHLFFMISGFVIYLTLNRTEHPLDFVASRFSRLYPAYWVAVCLTFLITTQWGLPGRESSLAKAIVNLSMIQSWLGVGHVDGVYWTLAVELVFYAWILVLFATRQLRRIEFLGCIWLVVTALYATVETLSGNLLPDIVEDSFLLRFGNLFLAGIFFYRLRAEPSWRRVGLVCLTFLVEVWLRPTSSPLIGLYFVIFALLCGNQLKILRVSVLAFLGSISYSLYLIHQNIGYVVMRSTYAAGIDHPIIVLGLPTAVSILLATAIYLVVETPSRRRIRQLYDARLRASILGTRDARGDDT